MRFNFILPSLEPDKVKKPKTTAITGIKNELSPKENDYPIIGIILRYSHLKGIQYISQTSTTVKKNTLMPK